MRQFHGLFRPSGAFFRLQFSAGYTINMDRRVRDNAAQAGNNGGKFLRQEKRFFLVVSGQEPDSNFRQGDPIPSGISLKKDIGPKQSLWQAPCP
jgi:hypothetical protein